MRAEGSRKMDQPHSLLRTIGTRSFPPVGLVDLSGVFPLFLRLTVPRPLVSWRGGLGSITDRRIAAQEVLISHTPAWP